MNEKPCKAKIRVAIKLCQIVIKSKYTDEVEKLVAEKNIDVLRWVLGEESPFGTFVDGSVDVITDGPKFEQWKQQRKERQSFNE